MDYKLLDVALTGSRKSGKHGVAQLFKKLGVPIFDADTVLKYLLNYKPELINSVQKQFGKEYVFNGYINPIAFDTDDKFNHLIDLVEFELFEAYDRFKKKTAEKESGYQYTMFLSSLIYERNWVKKFDKIVCIMSPKQDRMFRYQQETFDAVSTVNAIFENEMNDYRKNQMSDFIIHNYDGSIEDILTQIQKIDDKLVETYLLKKSRNVFSDTDRYEREDYIDLKNILTF
jgi:dephospho-CoA kinase